MQAPPLLIPSNQQVSGPVPHSARFTGQGEFVVGLPLIALHYVEIPYGFMEKPGASPTHKGLSSKIYSESSKAQVGTNQLRAPRCGAARPYSSATKQQQMKQKGHRHDSVQNLK